MWNCNKPTAERPDRRSIRLAFSFFKYSFNYKTSQNFWGVVNVHNKGVVVVGCGGQITQLSHNVYLPSLQQLVFSHCFWSTFAHFDKVSALWEIIINFRLRVLYIGIFGHWQWKQCLLIISFHQGLSVVRIVQCEERLQEVDSGRLYGIIDEETSLYCRELWAGFKVKGNWRWKGVTIQCQNFGKLLSYGTKMNQIYRKPSILSLTYSHHKIHVQVLWSVNIPIFYKPKNCVKLKSTSMVVKFRQDLPYNNISLSFKTYM